MSDTENYHSDNAEEDSAKVIKYMYDIHIFMKGYKHGVCKKKINYNN